MCNSKYTKNYWIGWITQNGWILSYVKYGSKYLILNKKFYRDCCYHRPKEEKGGEGERERERAREKHWFAVPLIYAFSGWFLYVPWPGIEPVSGCSNQMIYLAGALLGCF